MLHSLAQDRARQLSDERYEMPTPVYSWYQLPTPRSLVRTPWRKFRDAAAEARQNYKKIENTLFLGMLLTFVGAQYLLG